MTRNRPVLRLGGPLADHDLVADEVLAALRASPRDPERPASPQARNELPLQRPAALDVERLIDRLVRDPHRVIIGEVDAQPVGDLLRAPGARPPAVLTPRLVPPVPRPGRRPRHRGPVRPANLPRQPFLHVLPQPLVTYELRGLRTPSHHLRLPLRDRRPILQLPAASGRIASQLSGDRRWRAPDPPGDLTHTSTLRSEQRDLLPLSKRQVAPRQRGERNSWHPATVPKPPDTNRLRDPRELGGLHRRHPVADRQPEHRTIRPTRHRRPPRRPHHRPPRQLRRPSVRPAHRNPPGSSVATTS